MHTDPQPLLLLDRRDGVVTLTLNRPQRYNALSERLLGELQSAVGGLAEDPRARVVVLAGAGPAFCAGHDLKEMRALGRDGHERLFTACSRLMLSLVRLPQPVIARVHGIATAAGCQLVATCDLAVASSEARFATSGINVGLFCSTPGVALSRNLARKHAFEMLVTGDFIDAESAARVGLVNRVVAPETLDAAVEALAARITAKSPLAVATGKRAFYRQIELDLEAAYEHAASVMVENMQAADAAEGIDAFIEKRKPTWTGR